MKRHVYRRRRTMSFRMIACVHHRREAAGDGRALPDILVAHAIAGAYPAGWARDANGCGLYPRGWKALWRQCRHVDGTVTCVAAPMEVGSWLSGGAIGTPRPGWK